MYPESELTGCRLLTLVAALIIGFLLLLVVAPYLPQ